MKIPQISVEFFPPKTSQGLENLFNTIKQLQVIDPAYHSVTYGAGGSGQNHTCDTVLKLQQQGFKITPHISCINNDKNSIKEQLDIYVNKKINHLVVLRGDLPSGQREYGEFNYANELVEFIKSTYKEQFYITVAGYPEQHPQNLNPIDDIKNLKKKINAGAASIITQYFYNSDAFYRFCDECQKQNINVPIIAGIMPITNMQNLLRFSKICGTQIPRYIKNYLNLYKDQPQELLKFGQEVVTKMSQDLIRQGVAGLHFYTMNQAKPTIDVYKNLTI
jgi:methylenetetrahydrofolate reductase (NADPH)